ncbi:MAG: DUF3828 domain-containing protein [Anaeromyxobacter sp.]
MSVAVVVAALVAAAGPKAAVADDPAAVVREAYRIEKASLNSPGTPGPLDRKRRSKLFSRRMIAALESLDRQEGQGDLILDVDPFIEAQDVWDDHKILTDLQVKVLSQAASRAVVQAYFFNFEKRLIFFQLVKEEGRWVIDDVGNLAERLGAGR